MEAFFLKRLLAGAAAISISLAAKAQITQSSTQLAQPISPSFFGDDSILHLAGYFDTGYAIPEGDADEAFSLKFAPVVHYQYRNWLLFEAEGEFDFEDNGSSEKNSALEYAMLNVLVNDNLAIGVGKYMSPVGQFVQNLHPSWINKLPSMPIGFASGHHGSGAAPNNDFGIQARGGFQTGEKRIRAGARYPAGQHFETARYSWPTPDEESQRQNEQDGSQRRAKNSQAHLREPGKPACRRGDPEQCPQRVFRVREDRARYAAGPQDPFLSEAPKRLSLGKEVVGESDELHQTSGVAPVLLDQAVQKLASRVDKVPHLSSDLRRDAAVGGVPCLVQ